MIQGRNCDVVLWIGFNKLWIGCNGKFLCMQFWTLVSIQYQRVGCFSMWLMFISVHVCNFVHYTWDVDYKKVSNSDVMPESDLRVKHGLLRLWTLTLWMSWVPQMKRTELSPAPYFCRAACAAAIISGWVCNTSHSRVEYLSVFHIATLVLIVSWLHTLQYWSHQLHGAEFFLRS